MLCYFQLASGRIKLLLVGGQSKSGKRLRSSPEFATRMSKELDEKNRKAAQLAAEKNRKAAEVFELQHMEIRREMFDWEADAHVRQLASAEANKKKLDQQKQLKRKIAYSFDDNEDWKVANPQATFYKHLFH